MTELEIYLHQKGYSLIKILDTKESIEKEIELYKGFLEDSQENLLEVESDTSLKKAKLIVKQKNIPEEDKQKWRDYILANKNLRSNCNMNINHYEEEIKNLNKKLEVYNKEVQFEDVIKDLKNVEDIEIEHVTCAVYG
jgi:hypothetical protein